MQFTKADKPVGFKKNWWVDTASEKNKKGEELSGLCSFCNRWAAELKKGLCKEEDCIKGRELLALANGEAGVAITGLPGNREIHTIQGDQRVVKNNVESVKSTKEKVKLSKAQRRNNNKAAKALEAVKTKQAEVKEKRQEWLRNEWKAKLGKTFKTTDNKKIVTKEICDLLGVDEEIEELVITSIDDKVENYWKVGKDQYVSIACESGEAYKTMPASVSYDGEVYSKIEFAEKHKQSLYMLNHSLQNKLEKRERLDKAWKEEKQKRMGG